MADVGSLRGRADELTSLMRLLDDPSLPGAVLVGAAGMGKTALVRRLVEDARRRGWDVRVGAAALLDAALPFAPLAEALAGSPASGDDRAEALARLIRSGAGEDVAPGQQRWRVIDAVVDLLDAASRAQPVLLVLEDLHWADADTLRAVVRCWRAASHIDVAVVATTRPVAASSPTAGVSAEAVRLGCLEVEVLELSDEDLLSLAADVLGQPAGGRLAALLSRTEGNPFYALEVIAQLRAEGSLYEQDGFWDTDDDRLSGGVSAALTRHVDVTAAPSREVLMQAAVLGTRFRVEDLSLLRHESSSSVWSALQPALEARLLIVEEGQLRFRHDLLREALYEALPAGVREAFHLEIAHALAGDDERVGAHLALGARTSRDAERLLELAESVVDRAPAVASAWAARGIALLPPGDPVRTRARMLEARAAALGERPDRAVGLARALLDERLAPPAAAELWATIAQAEAYLGATSDTTADHIARVVAQLDPDHPRRDRMQALAARSLQAAGRADEAAVLAESVLTGPSIDSPASCLALGVLARHALDQGRADDAFALVERSLELARSGGTLLEWTGIETVKDYGWVRGIDVRDDRLVEVCEHVLVEGERLGLRAAMPAVAAELAETLRFRGRCREAEAYALAAIDGMSESGYATAEADAWFTVLLVASRRGDPEPFSRAPQPLARAQNAVTAGALGLAHAWALWHSGAQERAWEVAESARAWFEERSPDFMYVWGLPYVRLALARSETSRAASFAACIDAASTRMQGHPILLAQARMAQALLTQNPQLAAEAVQHARLGPVLPNQLDALIIAGEVLAVTGARDEAIAHLQEARHIAGGEADATVDLARIDVALRGLGVIAQRRRSRPALGWEALTEVERRVAQAVAEGLTYRQVGQRLYVSSRTVETHTASIFRKIGVRNRHEFAAAWHRREPQA